MKIFSSYFFIILTLLVSCSEKKERADIDKDLIEVYKLIDSERPIEAIGLVEDKLKREGISEEEAYSLEIAQATAYAKLAGFEFRKLKYVASGMIQLTESQKNISHSKEEVEKLQKEIDKLLAEDDLEGNLDTIEALRTKVAEARTEFIANNIDTISSYLKIILGVPLIVEKNLIFLEQAIFIMEENRTSLLPQDAIFSALLRVLLLKSNLSESFEVVGDDSGSCQLNLTELYGIILDNKNGLTSIFDDLAFARPDMQESLENVTLQIERSYDSLVTLRVIFNLLNEFASANVSIFNSKTSDELFKINCTVL